MAVDETCTQYKLREGTRFIGNGAFYNCSSLTSIVIPNSVTSIGGGAFRYCSSLASISIGNGITYLPSRLFANLPLTDVKVSWTTPAGLNISNDAFKDTYKITLHVPLGCTDKYKTRSPWNDFKEIVEYVPGGNEGKEKCTTPTVEVDGNELVFKCTTSNAKFYYTIECNDNASLSNSDNGRVPLSATCTVTVYAYADGYDNSETVKQEIKLPGEGERIVEVHDTIYQDKIIEVPVEVEKIVEIHDTIYQDKIIEVPVEVEVHDTIYVYDDTRSDIKLETGDVLSLYIRDGVVYIENAPFGSPIYIYKENGTMYKMETVEFQVAQFVLPRNTIYIIKVGETTFKVKI